jgi:hypothetical protein
MEQKKTTTKPTKGYGLIQTSAMTDPSISIEAKALYAYYAAVQGGKEESWKSSETIRKELGIGKNRFFKAKKELVNAGYITSEKRHDNSTHVSIQYNNDGGSPQIEDDGSPQIGDSNINKEYKHTNTAAADTNEAAVSPIWDELIRLNSEVLGEDAARMKMSAKDAELIKDNLESFDEAYILEVMGKVFTRTVRNRKMSTTRIKEGKLIGYSYINTELDNH